MIVKSFTAHGKDYEIRARCTGSNLEIRAYHDGKPANGYSYHVTLDVAHDLNVLAGQDAVKELAAAAKSDVEEKRYEKLLHALKDG